jgi:glycosyltransferase involved in cell wall biosynthesis
MVKVAYLLSTLKKTGPVIVLLNIIRNLDRKQFDPVIVTLSPEPENSMISQFGELGVRIETLSLSRIQGLIRARKELDKLLKVIAPDIIHSHGFRSDTLSAKINSQALKVSTLHNNPYVDYPMKFGYLRGTYMAIQSKKSYNKLDIPIACSRSIQHQMGLLGIQTECIQNGIDIELFQPIPDREKTDLRIRLNLPTDKLIHITTGSLIKRKGVDTILRGIALSRREDLLLLVIGDGPERTNLEGMLTDEQRIRFLGFQNNIHEYLNCADTIISASLSEGLPNGILEAMSCGLHCILSDIPSHRELSLPEGNRFFNTGDSNEVTAIIEQLSRDEASHIGKLNRDIAIKLFSSVKMAGDYQEHYMNNVG